MRDWVTQSAPKILGIDSVDLLQTLSHDTDAGVRNAAMHALTSLDARWARRLVPRYLEMLQSPDFQEVHQAIWRLTRFRTVSAIPLLQALAQHADWAPTRLEARAAVMVLEGREEDLISELRLHDHRFAHILMKAVLYQGTANAIGALEDFARAAPDPECREYARFMLGKREEVTPIVAN